MVLFQQPILLMVIASGRMFRAAAFVSGGSGRVQIMARDLLHVGSVDNEFLFGDAHRQQFSHALPGHGVAVLQISHMAFRTYGSGSVVCPKGADYQWGKDPLE